MKLTSALSAALLALAVAAPAAFAGPQLITDGTFDNGSATGWTGFQTANGTPDSVEVNPSAVYGLSNYNGNVFNLEVNANAVDTVQQIVTGLVVGDTYTLSFGYGDRAGGGPQSMDVSFGNQLLGVDSYDGSSPAKWTTNTFQITATSSTETLSFAGQPGDGLPSYGNEISDVSLLGNSAIAEPASVAILIAGLTGLTLLRRKYGAF